MSEYLDRVPFQIQQGFRQITSIKPEKEKNSRSQEKPECQGNEDGNYQAAGREAGAAAGER